MTGNSWKRYRKIRDAWLAGRACEKCGTTEGLIEACWRNPPGEFPTSRIWSMDDEKRQRYLADCVVLCRSCSTKRSGTGSRHRNDHGGGAEGIRGCKCDLCVQRRRKYGRERQKVRRGNA